MKDLIYMTTTTTNAVASGALIPLTTIARRKGSSIQGGSNSVVITKPGYYYVNATITYTGAVGDATMTLFKNESAITSITSTETIGTATTEIHSTTIQGIVRVFCCEQPVVLSIVNSGVAVTTSNVGLSVIEE